MWSERERSSKHYLTRYIFEAKTRGLDEKEKRRKRKTAKINVCAKSGALLTVARYAVALGPSRFLGR